MLSTQAFLLPGEVDASRGAVEAGVSLEVGTELVTRHGGGGAAEQAARFADGADRIVEIMPT